MAGGREGIKRAAGQAVGDRLKDWRFTAFYPIERER